MAARRDYFDGCGAAHALDLVGERWALLVVRELVLGPKRFTDRLPSVPYAPEARDVALYTLGTEPAPNLGVARLARATTAPAVVR